MVDDVTAEDEDDEAEVEDDDNAELVSDSLCCHPSSVDHSSSNSLAADYLDVLVCN